MILKAIKILPYLLPTTANVTMGVLNKPIKRDVVTNETTLNLAIPNNSTTNNNYDNSTSNYRYKYNYRSLITQELYQGIRYSARQGTFTAYGSIPEESPLYQYRYYTEYGNTTNLSGETQNLNSYETTIIYLKTPKFAYVNFTLNELYVYPRIANQFTEEQIHVYKNTTFALVQADEQIGQIYTNMPLYSFSQTTQNKERLNTYLTNTTSYTDRLNYRLEANRWDVRYIDDLFVRDPFLEQDQIYRSWQLIPDQTYYIIIFSELEQTAPIYSTELNTTNYTLIDSIAMNYTLAVRQAEVIYANTDIVDIPGLMFTILTLPFSFISQAFNLTLFPGTAYSVNISGIFLSIIALLTFAFIIKLVLGFMK